MTMAIRSRMNIKQRITMPNRWARMMSRLHDESGRVGLAPETDTTLARYRLRCSTGVMIRIMGEGLVLGRILGLRGVGKHHSWMTACACFLLLCVSIATCSILGAMRGT